MVQQGQGRFVGSTRNRLSVAQDLEAVLVASCQVSEHGAVFYVFLRFSNGPKRADVEKSLLPKMEIKVLLNFFFSCVFFFL